MDDLAKLGSLLGLLREYDVESYSFKDTTITMRFPKPGKKPAAVLLPDPQEQVDEFLVEHATDDEDEPTPEPTPEPEPEPAALKKLSPAHRALFNFKVKKSDASR